MRWYGVLWLEPLLLQSLCGSCGLSIKYFRLRESDSSGLDALMVGKNGIYWMPPAGAHVLWVTYSRLPRSPGLLQGVCSWEPDGLRPLPFLSEGDRCLFCLQPFIDRFECTGVHAKMTRIINQVIPAGRAKSIMTDRCHRGGKVST